MIAHWKVPMRSTFQPLLEGRQIGSASGDHEFATVALFQYCLISSAAGVSLLSFEPVLRDTIAEMKAYKQQVWTELTLLPHEATLVLMGKADDPAVRNGALMHLETGSRKVTEVMNTANLDFRSYECTGSCYRMMVAYFLGDLDVALAMAVKSENAIEIIPSSPLIRFQAFFDGLTALTAVRQNHRPCLPSAPRTSRRKLLSRGRKRLKMLRKFSKHCPENCEHHVLLLEAEFAALGGKVERAMSMYAKSEELASREGFMDIQALACERAGVTLREFGGDEKEASRMLERSIDLYKIWGAFAKADQMKTLLEK
jgi:hypothetical protein